MYDKIYCRQNDVTVASCKFGRFTLLGHPVYYGEMRRSPGRRRRQVIGPRRRSTVLGSGQSRRHGSSMGRRTAHRRADPSMAVSHLAAGLVRYAT